jgi:5-hydroxyisourate hydrolase
MNRAGRLTTHVLDTTLGRPAAGLKMELFWLEHGDRRRITTVKTNADGRMDAPLV